ncbi:MAG: Choline/Carnitine o-acyltransferase-domain-containing protein [Olpidium bornovanus]|uniref:Choline/Carnitine o-acyltransferase-domain-containing protein n=1 Tax=Olpidium bornovanus TaxID=278681 RepID=A0A8H7ZMM0_9FUNG|nr:MAG: Choline/Carnitine o-acyltransferase-domain-containing protein [Olpidium bornovanus]
MAIQLAYYRLFMVPCPTYETASTRVFRHGRTETVRVCSVDSVKFTESFDNGTKEERLALFQKAIASHLEYMQAASNGLSPFYLRFVDIRLYTACTRSFEEAGASYLVAKSSAPGYFAFILILCSVGKGVDRHLLGLRTRIANEDERATATLFTDPSYAKAMYFKLSTSNMSPGTYLWGGFAP